NRANRFPVSPPRRSPASSTSTLAPIPLRMLRSFFAMVPSCRDRLEMQTRSRNSSFSRAALIIDGSTGIMPPQFRSSRLDETEEATGLDGQSMPRLPHRQALDLRALLDPPRAKPRPRGHARELTLVRPRCVALDQERFERHGFDQLTVPVAVYDLGRDGGE